MNSRPLAISIHNHTHGINPETKDKKRQENFYPKAALSM